MKAINRASKGRNTFGRISNGFDIRPGFFFLTELPMPIMVSMSLQTLPTGMVSAFREGPGCSGPHDHSFSPLHGLLDQVQTPDPRA